MISSFNRTFHEKSKDAEKTKKLKQKSTRKSQPTQKSPANFKINRQHTQIKSDQRPKDKATKIKKLCIIECRGVDD